MDQRFGGLLDIGYQLNVQQCLNERPMVGWLDWLVGFRFWLVSGGLNPSLETPRGDAYIDDDARFMEKRQQVSMDDLIVQCLNVKR